MGSVGRRARRGWGCSQQRHDGHSEENSLALSEQARRSVGLREGDVALSTFALTIGVPEIVVERFGRAQAEKAMAAAGQESTWDHP